MGETFDSGRTSGFTSRFDGDRLGLREAKAKDAHARAGRIAHLGRISGDDNMLEVVGRADSQVKIRGYNVELTEVEAELLTHDEVRFAVVVDVERPGGGTALVAFCVPEQGCLPPVSALRRHLADHLSTYKIPSRFIVLDRLPVDFFEVGGDSLSAMEFGI